MLVQAQQEQTRAAVTILRILKASSTIWWICVVLSMNNWILTRKKSKSYVLKKKPLKMCLRWSAKTLEKPLKTNYTELTKRSRVTTDRWELKALAYSNSWATSRPRRPLLRRRLCVWLSELKNLSQLLVKTPMTSHELYNLLIKN